jgi:acetyltransferase-like isoleucine patch superfamily enzyme
MNLQYLWAKFFKKIRASSILNSIIDPTSKIESGCNIVNVVMQKYSFCGYDCEIINSKIGSFCSIANNVIIGGGMHPMLWVSTSPVFYKGRDSVRTKFSEHERSKHLCTSIDHDVWIGQYVLIKQGVHINTGAVIGMGSVVTKDIEPYSIVAGNPAELIRKRFDEEMIKYLLKSEWWNYDSNKLIFFAKYFKDPEEFLKMIKK